MAARRYHVIKVTRKRIAVTDSRSGSTDLYFPQVKTCVPIPDRLLGAYHVPSRVIEREGCVVDGNRLWDQLERWAAEGWKVDDD